MVPFRMLFSCCFFPHKAIKCCCRYITLNDPGRYEKYGQTIFLPLCLAKMKETLSSPCNDKNKRYSAMNLIKTVSPRMVVLQFAMRIPSSSFLVLFSDINYMVAATVSRLHVFAQCETTAFRLFWCRSFVCQLLKITCEPHHNVITELIARMPHGANAFTLRPKPEEHILL